MTRKGKLLVALFLLGAGTIPSSATNDTIAVTAGVAGKIANLISFGSGNVISEVGICDATVENRCATVSAGGAVSTNVTNAGRAVSGSSIPVVVTPAPTTWHLIAANTTNATSVKGSATTLFSCQLGNNSATIGYLKIYNKATAPTVGTDVPVKTLIIPGPTTGGGSNLSFGPGGLTLSLGFAAAVTGLITDADTTAVAATTFALNCDYE